MHIHLKTIGILLILLAGIHAFFPKYFNWNIELKPLSLINKQMMGTHTFFIAFTVFLMGVLCLSSATQLIETSLGRKMGLGLGIFWLIRLLFQFFVYSPKLWKGKTFETTMHIFFSVLWMYFSLVFTSLFFFTP